MHVYLYLGEGNDTPLQYSCLENPMDGGAWWAAVHGVAKRRTQLSDFTFTFHFHALEKEMATHSSVLAWRNPGMGEPGWLPSLGLHRVRHDWNDLAAYLYIYIFKYIYILYLSNLKKSWVLILYWKLHSISDALFLNLKLELVTISQSFWRLNEVTFMNCLEQW